MEKFSGLSKGVPAGLRWALFFLICFYLSGCSAIFSIFLAIAGGFATSLIVEWWQSKDELLNQPATEPKPAPILKPVKDAIERLGFKRAAPQSPPPSDLPVRPRPRIGARRLTSRRIR